MISIIVPISKVEEYLCRCVGSLLGQTCGDPDLLSEDGSLPDGRGSRLRFRGLD